ncbi:efflux RND transporter periplasmic adaptor subunit [Sphingomonas sp. HITSZ_GF]|uniref:efflux RND transporter periplasmic adaptor subunit n=1 Tax=Sphingomonas sp. HITSZ_GF TaxID=3037247 RepID=UPI00240E461B|nr:efflux RND transporter periplasmic adaptor subunit [Sphingomonas sp. HITSZ_GF]MDG2532551.1 efflux RND transporter periplasmic adaptor subunit [Sphingomonas sp. HITSZ_GF]
MHLKFAALPFLVVLAACGSAGQDPDPTGNHPEAVARHGAEGTVTLTPQQIATAGIELTRPSIGGSGGAIELPATIDSDPDRTRVVAAPIEGRVIALTRNLGDFVRRGETLAILESRAAADLQAEVERARSRLNLARVTLDRDEALYRRGFRPLSQVQISRADFEQAETGLRLARQQLAASGVRGGSLNRIVVTAPIAGRIVSRSATLGQVFMADAADTELFRVTDTGQLNVVLALSPADAARVKPGSPVAVTAPGRRATATLRFLSPALDPQTRLVRAMASLDNRAGTWRVGESVSAAVQLPGGSGDGTIRVPTTAVQTVEGRTVVFVRTDAGFRAVPVRLGRQDGGAVVVTGGLTGREQIAATNSFTLKSALGASEAGHED